MYALLKNELESAENYSTEVKVSFFDSVLQRKEVRLFQLSLSGAIVDDSYHKLCVDALLRDKQYEQVKECLNLNLEEAGITTANSYLDKKLQKVPNIHEKFAVGYQVLNSDFTAFICVVNQISEKENLDRAKKGLAANIRVA